MTAESQELAELRYPATRQAPTLIAGQPVGNDQARLSRPALRAFLNIMRRWSLKDDVACRLLGGIARSTLHAYMRDPDLILDQDKLTRVSHLIGLLKALDVLHGQDVADRWVALPNCNRIYMLQGGIPAMPIVRQLLRAAAEREEAVDLSHTIGPRHDSEEERPWIWCAWNARARWRV